MDKDISAIGRNLLFFIANISQNRSGRFGCGGSSYFHDPIAHISLLCQIDYEQLLGNAAITLVNVPATSGSHDVYGTIKSSY